VEMRVNSCVCHTIALGGVNDALCDAGSAS
jgi:hypothetical protein